MEANPNDPDGDDGDEDHDDGDDRVGEGSHPEEGDTSDAAGEWRFSLEDIDRRTGEEDDEDGGGNIAGSFTPDETIEAGDIDVENAAFVLLGVALAVLVVVGFMNVLP